MELRIGVKISRIWLLLIRLTLQSIYKHQVAFLLHKVVMSVSLAPLLYNVNCQAYFHYAPDKK